VTGPLKVTRPLAPLFLFNSGDAPICASQSITARLKDLPSIFCDIPNRAILRCKNIFYILTGASCSAFLFLETQIPGFTPGANDILPFQGMDKIRPARMFFSSRMAAKIW